MTTTRFTQISDNAPSLQTAGCTYREDTLYITPAAFALGAETALASQNSLTHNTLSGIVGWIYALIIHQRPKMFTMFQDFTTFASQFALTGGALFKKSLDTLDQRLHSVLKSMLLVSAFKLVGQGRVNKFSTVFTAIHKLEILGHVRNDWRYVDELMTQWPPRLLRRHFGGLAKVLGKSEDGGLEEFCEFIPTSRSSSSIRFFKAAFSVSSCFIYASLSIKQLSDKGNVLLKFAFVPQNWVNAYYLLYRS